MASKFANRLAGGGYWALRMAAEAHRITEALNERGYKPPVGDGTPDEVLMHCGIAAFELVCNCYIPNGGIHATVQRVPKTYNRLGVEVPYETWRKLHTNNDYRRVAMWENDCGGDIHVSTIWTGVDPKGGNSIFETVAIKECGDHYHVGKSIGSATEADALATHNGMVAAVMGGFL